MTKFLIQVISRYQDSLPITFTVHAQESEMNETVALELLHVYDNEMWPDEAKEFLKNGKVLRGEKCWCIWGEEEDIIMTALS